MKKMMDNIRKTKAELRRRKLMYARSRLTLKKFCNKNKVTIDVNVKVNK